MNEIIITRENSYSDKINLNENHFGSYYSYEDILNTYPEFNKSHFGRKVLQKYEITEKDYSYIVFYDKTRKYKFYDENFCKAKLFFKKEWVEKTMGFFEKDYIKMPPLLEIENIPDFFKNGNYMLKFRGEKHKDKIYVSVESVAKILKINYANLKNNLITNKYELEKNKHYVLCGYKDKNNNFIKVPYFTYTGFIMYFFITRSSNAMNIVSYCETILFNSMFGSSEEKSDMVLSHIVQTPKEIATLKKKLGIPISESKQITTIFGKVSCLYLLMLKENKNSYIVKFGMTGDLKKRMNTHLKNFGDVFLKICRCIDETELNNAENELYEIFNEKYTSIKNWPENDKTIRKEVFEIKKCDLKFIKKFYDTLTLKYGKKVTEINKNIKISEKNKLQEIMIIKHNYELQIKDLENLCAIKDKDLENLNLKLEMANLKLSIYSK